MFGLGATTLRDLNEEMNGIMKLLKSLEESGLLMKGINESIPNEAQEQKFPDILLGTLGTSFLGNLLTG